MHAEYHATVHQGVADDAASRGSMYRRCVLLHSYRRLPPPPPVGRGITPDDVLLPQ